MKVVVTNAVVSNTGDAAIFAGIRESLIQSGACGPEDITLMDSNARQMKGRYPSWNIIQQMTAQRPLQVRKLWSLAIRFRRVIARPLTRREPGRWAQMLAFFMREKADFIRAYRAVENADLVISTGGTYLVDHYRFADRALELEIANRLGTPVVLWTQSLGPFETSQARSSIERIIRVSDKAFFRDARSLASWVAAGGEAEDSCVVPDSAFALLKAVPTTTAPKRRALVSVREWGHHGPGGRVFDAATYASAMRRVVGLVSKYGLAPVAMSTCQGISRYTDDSVYAAKIFGDLDVTIDSDFHTPQQLLTELTNSAFVITTRMHMAILALMCQVPTLAIAYEFKTLELFRNLGLSRFVISLEDLSEDSLEERARELLTCPDRGIVEVAQLKALCEGAMAPARALG